jgi:phenylpropionate dioxygenase-like ring-hydroxylating dioxygenase large terminal subunit
VDGACLDMPSEPPESNFHTKVKLKTYRTEERNGLIWIYMGPDQDAPPPLSALEWNMAPQEHCYITKRVVQNNYVQAMEGGIDSSYSSFLHASFKDPHRLFTKQEQGMVYKVRDRHPRFEVVDTDYGVLIGARRNAEEDS